MLAVVAVFAAAVAIAAVGLGLSPDTAARPGDAERVRVAAARERLMQWYGQHLAELDGVDAFPRSPSDALRAADLDAAADLRFAAGPRGGAGAGYRWRPLALWLAPGVEDRSGFDADGRFVVDPAVRASIAFSSEALQRAAYAASEQRLRILASMAELRFLAKLRADPDHDLARNWFRAADCARLDDADEVPCTAVGSPLPVAQLMARSGELGGAFRRNGDVAPGWQPDPFAINAWGDANWFDNAPDLASAGPPFSMRFSTTTPFSTRIEVVAVQPVE